MVVYKGIQGHAASLFPGIGSLLNMFFRFSNIKPSEEHQVMMSLASEKATCIGVKRSWFGGAGPCNDESACEVTTNLREHAGPSRAVRTIEVLFERGNPHQ